MFRIVDDDVKLGVICTEHGVETVATYNILERCHIKSEQQYRAPRGERHTPDIVAKMLHPL